MQRCSTKVLFAFSSEMPSQKIVYNIGNEFKFENTKSPTLKVHFCNYDFREIAFLNVNMWLKFLVVINIHLRVVYEEKTEWRLL